MQNFEGPISRRQFAGLSALLPCCFAHRGAAFPNLASPSERLKDSHPDRDSFILRYAVPKPGFDGAPPNFGPVPFLGKPRGKPTKPDDFFVLRYEYILLRTALTNSFSRRLDFRVNYLIPPEHEGLERVVPPECFTLALTFNKKSGFPAITITDTTHFEKMFYREQALALENTIHPLFYCFPKGGQLVDIREDMGTIYEIQADPRSKPDETLLTIKRFALPREVARDSRIVYLDLVTGIITGRAMKGTIPIRITAHEIQTWDSKHQWMWKEMRRLDPEGNIETRCLRE